MNDPVHNIEYRNENRLRWWPLLSDVDHGALDTGLLVAASFTIYGNDSLAVTLISVERAGPVATLLIGTPAGPVPVIVALPAHPDEYTEVELSSGSIDMQLTVGFSELADGLHTFHDPLQFEPGTVTSAAWLTSLDHLLIQNGDGPTVEVPPGPFQIRAGYNMNVSFNRAANTIIIRPGVGDGLGRPCAPMYPAGDCSDSIFFINGLHADWSGTFYLLAGAGITVTNVPAAHLVKISAPIPNPDTPGCTDG